MEKPSPLGAEQEAPKWRELYPSPEDWQALQGGKPRVFRNPFKPGTRWIVLHVYDEHSDARSRFQSGAKVDTLPPDKIRFLRKGIVRTTEDGDQYMRDIMVPSFMDRTVHGDVCEDRSIAAGGDRYPRVRNQEEYRAFIEDLRATGFEELRFGVGPDGFTLTTHAIRDPRPLDDPR